MKIVEIRREADSHSLRTAWNDLLRSSSSNTIFVTWEWMTAWWSAYGNASEMRTLAIFDDDGVLRGIAPLRSQAVRKYGQTVKALSFIGDSSIEGRPSDSDYLDFIVAQGYEKQVIDAVCDYAARSTGRGVVLLLNEIPVASSSLQALRDIVSSRNMSWRETDVACATVALPGDWDEYVKTLQPRFRTKVRSVVRNLESRPEVQFRFCTDAAQLERVLPALFDLHTARWGAEGQPGVFGWDCKRDFYFKVSRLLLERQWLRLTWLEWNGRILACQYGFAYGSTYFQLQEGYEPASEHWNLGIGLRAWSMREFIKQGIREYDFLGGVGRHKAIWGADIKLSKRIAIAEKSYTNVLFREGTAWESSLRLAARKLLPEKVFAARDLWLRRQPANPSSRNWLRCAAAETYVRSGLPWVMKHARSRSGSAARILYYHRVNDEKDPLLGEGTVSTQLFEQQMRHLARHHNVVAIPELMRHLSEGSDGSVVAITFDDGYADNYQNAYPILRRYGLPATIFLTTGSVDSGERLWFEQLASAIQLTSCEYIDLEIDIPRRFRLRTLEERAAANGAIFKLLRKIDEASRRYWLAEIHRLLGPAASSEAQTRMLTWDQVRLMNANGIEFGGHTVTHPFLSRLDVSEAEWEVTECKRRIEQELQKPVEYFAYPNGREEDFSAANKDLLRRAGYRAAFTTIWGVNYQFTDPLELRRGGPWESSPAVFATKLDWYQLTHQ